jgi:hypothetical protein
MRVTRILVVVGTVAVATTPLLEGCRCATVRDESGRKVTRIGFGEPRASAPAKLAKAPPVNAPTTLDAVRAKGKEPGLVAQIDPVTIHWDTTGQVANCGHAGPACLLVMLLPRGKGSETYHKATITRAGREVYQGTFGEDGTFRAARVEEGDTVRYLKRIDAGRPRRSFVVTARQAPLAPDGKEGEPRPVSILDQVDLGPEYLDQLVEDQKHHRHRPGGLGDTMAKRESKARFTFADAVNAMGPDDARRLLERFLQSDRLNDSVKAALREEAQSLR